MSDIRIYNTTGAANYLNCKPVYIHKLVYRGKLQARIYDDEGKLVERQPHDTRQGQGLYFLEEDLKEFQKNRKKPGRPTASKDKKLRKTTGSEQD